MFESESEFVFVLEFVSSSSSWLKMGLFADLVVGLSPVNSLANSVAGEASLISFLVSGSSKKFCCLCR